MSKSVKKWAVIIVCAMSLILISPQILGETSQEVTIGKVVLEKEVKNTLSEKPGRVDKSSTPIKKNNLLPQTGELTKPFLVLLGGLLVTMVVFGLYYSLKENQKIPFRKERGEME